MVLLDISVGRTRQAAGTDLRAVRLSTADQQIDRPFTHSPCGRSAPSRTPAERRPCPTQCLTLCEALAGTPLSQWTTGVSGSVLPGSEDPHPRRDAAATWWRRPAAKLRLLPASKSHAQKRRLKPAATFMPSFDIATRRASNYVSRRCSIVFAQSCQQSACSLSPC